MQRADVTNGIYNTWKMADELGIAEVFSNPAPLPVNEEFRNIIYSSESLYTQTYIAGLSLSHYNILLSDYSYFQFSWESEHCVRYAFYPNPFISGNDDEVKAIKKWRDLVESDFLTHEEFLRLLTDRPPSSGVPMFRYENAPSQRKKFKHPCSHFHIGFHSENRWPLERILTPYAFSLLVFKAYYGLPWIEYGDEEEPEIGNRFERILLNEKSNCPIVPQLLFENVERRTFFFG
ncbi:hypothetical protein J2X19_005122 [Rhodoferax ferrireducens]|uniref:DUF2290 domain-containing protein n=1 Tax=Rhodoferax ferrireducens TaxID=192843 RepID=A0ABU2CGH1_9BURK|nr:DUF2290 domain-containing protein [Rhodoferax ferrireducens]MDR7380415.1 hypothetical protein [Rhodoferax ferrireducens]